MDELLQDIARKKMELWLTRITTEEDFNYVSEKTIKEFLETWDTLEKKIHKEGLIIETVSVKYMRQFKAPDIPTVLTPTRPQADTTSTNDKVGARAATPQPAAADQPKQKQSEVSCVKVDGAAKKPAESSAKKEAGVVGRQFKSASTNTEKAVSETTEDVGDRTQYKSTSTKIVKEIRKQPKTVSPFTTTEYGDKKQQKTVYRTEYHNDTNNLQKYTLATERTSKQTAKMTFSRCM